MSGKAVNVVFVFLCDVAMMIRIEKVPSNMMMLFEWH